MTTNKKKLASEKLAERNEAVDLARNSLAAEKARVEPADYAKAKCDEVDSSGPGALREINMLRVSCKNKTDRIEKLSKVVAKQALEIGELRRKLGLSERTIVRLSNSVTYHCEQNASLRSKLIQVLPVEDTDLAASGNDEAAADCVQKEPCLRNSERRVEE